MTEPSRMELLQQELLLTVLGFAGVALSVKLSGCNKNLQQRIFHLSDLWIAINLSFCFGLTDYELSRLLIKVNAREYTKILDLEGCICLRGPGLFPLRRSRILERVDLRGTGAMMNVTPFLDTLKSMLPFNLCKVNFRYGHVRVGDRIGPMEEFIQSLRTAKRDKALEENTQCHSCHEQVVDKRQQILANLLGFPEIHCEKCRKQYCHRAACPANLTACNECGDSHCQNCLPSSQCDDCAQFYCAECHAIRTCQECMRQLCYQCESVAQCFECKKTVCRGCCNELDISFSASCYECNNRYCPGCMVVQECDACHGSLCLNCEEMNECESCQKAFCQGCKDMNRFDCCDKETCTDCSETQTCETCNKDCCEEHLNTCGVCSVALCLLCQDFEQCDACDTSFCKDHDRFVDCIKCDMRHCRGEECAKRCELCARCCYEACGCDGRSYKKRRKN